MLMIVPDNLNQTSHSFSTEYQHLCDKENVDVQFLVYPIYSSWIVVAMKLVFRNVMKLFLKIYEIVLPKSLELFPINLATIRICSNTP